MLPWAWVSSFRRNDETITFQLFKSPSMYMNGTLNTSTYCSYCFFSSHSFLFCFSYLSGAMMSLSFPWSIFQTTSVFQMLIVSQAHHPDNVQYRQSFHHHFLPEVIFLETTRPKYSSFLPFVFVMLPTLHCGFLVYLDAKSVSIPVLSLRLPSFHWLHASAPRYCQDVWIFTRKP